MTEHSDPMGCNCVWDNDVAGSSSTITDTDTMLDGSASARPTAPGRLASGGSSSMTTRYPWRYDVCACGARKKKASLECRACMIRRRAAVASATATDRFWSYVDRRGPDECWNWRGAPTASGYGEMGIVGGKERAHRFSWALHNGPVPSSLHVLHHCDNRLCCNPAHLFLGTNLDNIADRVAKGRSTNPLRGEQNRFAKLTEADIPVIRARLAAGARQWDIARDFGVGQAVISAIKRGVAWRHVQ